MRAPADLHPDDLAYRIGLRDLLIARRRQLGYSQQHLARVMRVPQSTVARFEVGQPWRVDPTQDLAHALDLRLVLLPDNVAGGPYVMLLADERLTVQQQHAMDRRHLIAALVVARQACGLTRAEVAARLGIHVNVLGRFETNHGGGLMLANCQRYLRVLGGELWIGTEPIDPTATAVSPLLIGAAA